MCDSCARYSAIFRSFYLFFIVRLKGTPARWLSTHCCRLKWGVKEPHVHKLSFFRVPTDAAVLPDGETVSSWPSCHGLFRRKANVLSFPYTHACYIWHKQRPLRATAFQMRRLLTVQLAMGALPHVLNIFTSRVTSYQHHTVRNKPSKWQESHWQLCFPNGQTFSPGKGKHAVILKWQLFVSEAVVA